MSGWRIEPLGKQDRTRFSSGSAALDDYFHRRVTQDIRRRIAFCFILLGNDDGVGGYYTLSASALAFESLSSDRARMLPRYPSVPVVLLGRLAVDQRYQRQGLGAVLVADAILRASRSEIASYAMLVEAKDDLAARFYQHLGFDPLAGDPRRLIRAL